MKRVRFLIVFSKNEIRFKSYDDNRDEVEKLYDYDINEMYKQQMIDYLDWIKGKNSINCNFIEGKKINELIEKLESTQIHNCLNNI